MVKKMNNNLVSFYLFFGVFLGFFRFFCFGGVAEWVTCLDFFKTNR